MSLLVLSFYGDVRSWYIWSGQKILLHLCISDWPVWPWVGIVTLEAVNTVGPPILVVLVLLPFGWRLPVFPWSAIGTWSWLHRFVLRIRVASRWLASWGLYLTGLRSWSWWWIILPACDAILGVPLGGVLMTGVLDQTQWHFWSHDFSPESCSLSRWCYPHLFSPYCCWVWLGLPHPRRLYKWHMVPGIRRADTILDGRGPPLWWPQIFSADRPLRLIGRVRY